MTINIIHSAVELSEGNLLLKVIKRKAAKKCVIVRDINCKKRVAWCRERRNWTVDSPWSKYTLSKKRNAYSISHGFIFKVNKKTYYVKSIKIKNIYQQSLSHKFWNWTHVWESEVLRYVRVVPQNDNSMIRSNVNIESVHRWHQAQTAHGVS